MIHHVDLFLDPTRQHVGYPKNVRSKKGHLVPPGPSSHLYHTISLILHLAKKESLLRLCTLRLAFTSRRRRSDRKEATGDCECAEPDKFVQVGQMRDHST